MLWWAVDEAVAELFARHPQASNFDGNPMSMFRAKIRVNEYGPDKMPSTIGLYGGWYTVIVYPGECILCALLCPHCVLAPSFFLNRHRLRWKVNVQRYAGGGVVCRRAGGGGVWAVSLSGHWAEAGVGWLSVQPKVCGDWLWARFVVSAPQVWVVNLVLNMIVLFCYKYYTVLF